VPISELAEAIASKMGADVQMWAPEKEELWGVVEVGYLKERIGYEPMADMQDIISEAMANASF
jgi:nucleoside-diphosphate-sugar epimerase